MPFQERTFDCEACDIVLDRDLNASLNLKHLAIMLFGPPPVE
jgi:transposase